jgi:signal transduction histidine kinase
MAVLYFSAARVGILVSVANGSVSPVWPAAGLAITACLLLGYSLSFGMLIGGFLFTYIETQSWVVGIGAGLTNLVECTLATFLIRNFVSRGYPLATTRQVFRYTIFGALVPCVVGGFMGATAMCLGGTAPWAHWTILFSTWCLGDFMGAMIVAPFLLTFYYHPVRKITPKIFLEAMAMTFLIIAGNIFIFFSRSLSFPMADLHFPLVFLCVPMLIWAAFRFEHHGAVSAVLLTSIFAITQTTLVTGSGPGPMGLPARAILLVQYYMAVTTITVLVLASAASDARRVQERLNRQARELVRSNQDLQQFAYVASHDLQEPLRMVASYCQLLGRRYHDTLDGDGQAMMKHIVAGADRMRLLIQDLLAYSRVGQTYKGLVNTDCNRVLAQAIVDMGDLATERDLVVTHDPLPTVLADPLQLELLFRNLLTNSVKYCDKPPARVHIHAEQVDGGWNFSVTDNGIGIDPKHHERIFLIFQRLHSRDKYAGTGIGLAICKKIVESHGGRIWVDSEPGRGSVFSFNLPLKGAPSAWVPSV